MLTVRWRRDYNQVRPHSALGYRPPTSAGSRRGIALRLRCARRQGEVTFRVVQRLGAGQMASLYFWLLNRFEGAGALWWVILFGGLFIGLV